MKHYLKNYYQLSFGLFVHFGLYSIEGKGEWLYHVGENVDPEEYFSLKDKFNVKKDWAKNLVSFAKKIGCRYITLTTRHHDGFSLYDTCGLNDFDAVHSASKRDLVREFVDACNEEGVSPFFYHTMLDWKDPHYQNDFDSYWKYLYQSIELLCKNYGKIGGIWLDGAWDKDSGAWKEDELFGMIKRLQPEAILINNTGLNRRGEKENALIDAVTFERGKAFPSFDKNGEPILGEACQTLNDHWGFAGEDCNYKAIHEFIEELCDCKKNYSNLLLNTGLKGDGSINLLDQEICLKIAKWIHVNKEFFYHVVPTDITADNAYVLKDDKYYYAIITKVPMSVDRNVTNEVENRVVSLHTNKLMKNPVWLDNEEKIELSGPNSFAVVPFRYGCNYCVRVARFLLEDK